MDGFPDGLLLSRPDWPDGTRELRPGDLAQFMPQGFGLGGPTIITPYGSTDGSFYGFDKGHADPMQNAPTTESSGGTVYFDGNAGAPGLVKVLELLGVFRTKDYVAFSASSRNPVEERYLDQLRFVSTSALTAVFGATVPNPVPEQSLDIFQAFDSFLEAQRQKWNDDHTYSSKLSGTAGGDGDWAKERLAFGFHVENTYWGIYRVWSRAWLVTK